MAIAGNTSNTHVHAHTHLAKSDSSVIVGSGAASSCLATCARKDDAVHAAANSPVDSGGALPATPPCGEMWSLMEELEPPDAASADVSVGDAAVPSIAGVIGPGVLGLAGPSSSPMGEPPAVSSSSSSSKVTGAPAAAKSNLDATEGTRSSREEVAVNAAMFIVLMREADAAPCRPDDTESACWPSARALASSCNNKNNSDYNIDAG